MLAVSERGRSDYERKKGGCALEDGQSDLGTWKVYLRGRLPKPELQLRQMEEKKMEEWRRGAGESSSNQGSRGEREGEMLLTHHLIRTLNKRNVHCVHCLLFNVIRFMVCHQGHLHCYPYLLFVKSKSEVSS